MIVSRDEKWKIGLSHLNEYYGSHGHCNVPRRYISPDGYHLGLWVEYQRIAFKHSKLCRERYELLSNLNFRFNVNNTNTTWLNGYNHLIDYFNNCGNVNVPQSYISPDGYHLGQWVSRQRQVFKCSRLDHERYELLKNIKFPFDTNRSNPKPAWENGYNHLIDYCRIHRSGKVPVKYISPDGFKLGNWVMYNKFNYKLLSITQIKKLEATGFFPLWHETHTW